MKTTLTPAFVLVICLALAQIATAQPSITQPTYRPEKGGHNIVGNSELAASLSSGNAKERITGRVSFNFVTSADDGPREVRVQNFNVAFFGVPQRLIAGNAPIQEPLGLLGFALASDKPQTLRYDAQKNEFVGELQLFADASFLNAFADPARDGKNDQFDTPTIPATATVRIVLDKPIGDQNREAMSVGAVMELQLRTRGLKFRRYDFPPFDVTLLDRTKLKLDVAPLIWFELARKLCIQPVRLMRFTFSGFPPVFNFQLTGEGLPFGEPGLRTEWRKADVVFEIREWKTLFNSSFFVTSESETDELRALVDDDDCIEVFFVRDFSPQDLFGGGATFGSGTASAKVISSDGNARGGIDFTHLAHEVGHVLGLRHPGAAPTASAQPASTGTLLCPSGFLRDNPRVNSQQNKDLVSNPLLVLAIKLRTAGPDCQNSADCGVCP
ncbi:MAG TPA: hypothetical protein VIT88_07505 [Pyrinomonadaceae bacterium]